MTTFLEKNGFYRLMTKFAWMVVLSILWLVCSIPLITIGASTAALHSITMKMVRDEEGTIVSGFFTALRRNLRQGILLTLFVSAWFMMIWANWNYTLGFSGYVRYLGGAMFALLLFVGLLTITVLFHVQARFAMSVKQTLLVSMRMALGCLPQSVALLLLAAVMLYACYVSAGLLCAFLAAGIGLYSYISSMLWRRTFATVLEQEDHV